MTSVAPPESREQLAYHTLARSWPRARWWRPLVGLLLAVGIYVAAIVLLVICYFVVSIARNPTGGLESALREVNDYYDPTAFSFTMLSIVLMLPAALLGFWIAGCRPVGLLSSVAGRLRWRWLLRCAFPAVVLLGVVQGLSLGVSAAQGQAIEGRVGSPALFVLILVFVPFQAAAEEYAFRGVLMQTIGAWLRNPWWAILLPVPLFVIGHVYDVPGLVSVGAFAVAAAWITWRTGGLEAAISLHIVNNLAAFLFGAAGFGDLNATEVDLLSALISSVVPFVYVWWIDRMMRRDTAALSSAFPAPARSDR